MPSHHPPSRRVTPLEGTDSPSAHFHRHRFQAECYGTLACSIVYDRREFGTRWRDSQGDYDRATPPLPAEWLPCWEGKGGHLVVPRDHEAPIFPGLAELEWTARDGSRHVTRLDFDALARQEPRVRGLPMADVPAREGPRILLVVDDRTVHVYMRTCVSEGVEQHVDGWFACWTEVTSVWSRTF
ncbi:hypothetical protein ACQKIE_14505 [Luteibacter sp. NPDC031894]|uniref:hypothetical protein n=1 Tax=Luteibacter sp. NPDC031894 TaxID=3390572 RepID=UPI003D020F29